MAVDMFELAVRSKFRFVSPKGLISAEDLWDLPLTSKTNAANLDDIARALFKQLRSDDGVSFVHEETSSDPTVQAKFDLVKYVIDVKKAEKKTADEARGKNERKQLLLGILADREHDDLRKMTPEDLRKAIAEL